MDRNVSFQGMHHRPNHGASSSGAGGSNSSAHHQLQPLSGPNAGPNSAMKASVLWRDFMNGIRRRKRMLKAIKQASLEAPDQAVLKQQLMDLRQATLRVVEDSLEIEYRVKLASDVLPKGFQREQLPLLTSYRQIEGRDDLKALAEMITDADELLRYPAVRAMFPNDFPLRRNPFIFGKNVDELCEIVAPAPEAGNIAEELKVLELMRFKRAAKALLRAEIQIINALPITLGDVEDLLLARTSDPHVDLVFRAACSLLYNDQSITQGEEGPGLRILNDSRIIIEAQDVLLKLNAFRGESVPNATLKAAVRHACRDLPLTKVRGNGAIFLIEWMGALLGPFGISSEGGSVGRGGGSQQGPRGRSPHGGPRPRGDAGGGPGAAAGGGPGAPYDFWAARGASRSPSREATMLDDSRGPYAGAGVGAGGVYGNKANAIERGWPGPGPGQGNAGPEQGGGGPPGLARDIVKRMTLGTMGYRGPESRDGARPASSDGFGAGLADASLLSDDTSAAAKRALSHMPSKDSSASGKELSSALVSQKRSSLMPVGSDAIPRSKISDEKLWGKVRGEVNKILKKHGIGRKHEKRELMDDNGGDLDALEPETLSSVRYELVKLQQELMRRKVLDPRHYAALSVDTLVPHRDKETQDMNIKTRFSDRGFMESKAAAAPSKLAKLMGTAKASDPTIGKMLTLAEASAEFSNGDRAIVELVLDMDTEVLIGKIHRMVDLDADNPFKNEEKRKKKVRAARQTVAYARANKLLVNRLTGTTPEAIRSVPRDAHEERAALIAPIMDQLLVRASQDPPPRGRLILIADRVIMEKNIVSGGIAANMVIERDEDDSGVVITVTPVQSLATPPGTAAAGRTLTLANLIRDPMYGSTSLRVSDKELRILLLNQRGLYDLAMVRWSSMVTVANWLSSRVVLSRTDMALPAKPTGTPGRFKAAGSTSPPKKVSLTEPGVLERSMMAAGGGGAVGGEKYTSAGSNRAEVVELKLNRKVELPSDAKKQWKSRNLPIIRGMEVRVVAYQEMELLVFQVTLSIPI